MTLLDHIAYLALLAITFAVVTIAGFAVFHNEQSKNVFRAGDKLFAALFGFDGYHTLSAECGRLAATGGPTWPAKAIDFVFGKGHCHDAAVKEGLLLL